MIKCNLFGITIKEEQIIYSYTDGFGITVSMEISGHWYYRYNTRKVIEVINTVSKYKYSLDGKNYSFEAGEKIGILIERAINHGRKEMSNHQ